MALCQVVFRRRVLVTLGARRGREGEPPPPRTQIRPDGRGKVAGRGGTQREAAAVEEEKEEGEKEGGEENNNNTSRVTSVDGLWAAAGRPQDRAWKTLGAWRERERKKETQVSAHTCAETGTMCRWIVTW